MKGKREGEREKETLERGRQRETLGEGDGGEKNRGRGVEICIRNTFIYFHYFSKSSSGNNKYVSENSISLKTIFIILG